MLCFMGSGSLAVIMQYLLCKNLNLTKIHKKTNE